MSLCLFIIEIERSQDKNRQGADGSQGERECDPDAFILLAFSHNSLLAPIFFPKRVDLAFDYQPSPIVVGLRALVLKGTEKTPVWLWVQDLSPETLAGIRPRKDGAAFKRGFRNTF